MTGSNSSKIRSHYHNNYECLLELFATTGKLSHASCVGFICTQGAQFLKGAELGKVKVLSVTNGDGNDGSEWRELPQGEYVYCMVLRTKGNPPFKCYILVDDNGWPILSGNHPYDYMPTNPDFINSVSFYEYKYTPNAK
jgi:hypothetical protein